MFREQEKLLASETIGSAALLLAGCVAHCISNALGELEKKTLVSEETGHIGRFRAKIPPLGKIRNYAGGNNKIFRINYV